MHGKHWTFLRHAFFLGCVVVLPTIGGCTERLAIKSCPADALAIQQIGGDAGMGHRTLAYAFINTTDTTCSLYGFPVVTPLGEDGQVIDSVTVTHVNHNYLSPQQEMHAIELSPGQRAWFEIGYSVIPQGNVVCPQIQALRLRAPGARHGAESKQPIWPCDGIEVLPLQGGPPPF